MVIGEARQQLTLESVDEFTYLESNISRNGDSTKDVD